MSLGVSLDIITMPDANEAMGDPLSPSARIMPGTFSPSPSQRRSSSVALRRTSSAPDLREISSLGTPEESSNGQSSSTPSSASRSSYSHSDWRPNDTHEHRPAITLLPQIPTRVRSPRSVTQATPVPAPEQGNSQNMELLVRRMEELRRTLSRRQRRGSRPTLRGAWVITRGFFGYGPEGTAARRDMVSLTTKMSFNVGQIAATIALLCVAAIRKSPTRNNVNEWQACGRPLGAWCAIWCIRVLLNCIMAVWGYRRRASRLAETIERVGHAEPGVEGQAHVPHVGARSRAAARRTNSNSRLSGSEARLQTSAVTFARLTSLHSLLSLIWFIIAHILIYTSVHTCRFSAPHLWWLTFGIICIGYLVIVEVILVAFLVFILGPLIFLLLNIILICMGRHPLRVPGNISPEVGKLPHKAVDRIPLVLYIPAPTPKKEPPVHKEASQSSSAHPGDASTPQLAVPQPAHVHSYPPESERPPVSPASEPGTHVQSRSRRLFTFRRIRLRKRSKDDKEKGKEKQAGMRDEEQGYRYEDKWEKGEYPFVKLENNRAACAICLCDFEEPRRVRYSLDSRPAQDLDEAEKTIEADSTSSQAEGELRLTDAGEGAQPLRLLECAHVFHKTCLDPWLTEVSGRCPVCQRAVEVNEGPSAERTSRRRGRRREG